MNTINQLIDKLKAKKAGKNFKALCPFHKEKTASFMLNPNLGIFHCFGCGRGGTFEYLTNLLNERTDYASKSITN